MQFTWVRYIELSDFEVSIFLSTNRFFIAKINFDRYKLMDRISIDIIEVSNFKQYIEFQCLSIDKSFYTCF